MNDHHTTGGNPAPRVPLYERLPEIYRIRDMEQNPPGQLKAYLSLVEQVFGEIRGNIEDLYGNLFIETCQDWAIPYIGDLLGTSHLGGDPWTLRADVADTMALRRSKGTLAGIQRLAHDLTGWAVHCVELRERLAWSQHPNHLRPDVGGDGTLFPDPPGGISGGIPGSTPGLTPGSSSSGMPDEPSGGMPGDIPSSTPMSPSLPTLPRGGMAPVRDPALLSLIDTPFDPFSHLPDLKRPAMDALRYNLPDLAVFLWRLAAYRVRMTRPVHRGIGTEGSVRAIRFDIHPAGIPLRLFNTYQYDPARDPPVITSLDATPGPIHPARITAGTASGNPGRYMAIDTYDPADPVRRGTTIPDVGLIFHLPEPLFAGEAWKGASPTAWRIRGANLCAWEMGIRPSIRDREIVIDPNLGRIIVGVATTEEARALTDHLLITYTYGAVGPVGAHPVIRSLPQPDTGGEPPRLRVVDGYASPDPHALEKALGDLGPDTSPVVVEIRDSLTHHLDPGLIPGISTGNGGPVLRPAGPLIIRAADGHRPVIRLRHPLLFSAHDPARAAGVTVRLEGLYITRQETPTAGEAFPAGEPLIARAALNALEIVDCTLDPGGHRCANGTKAPVHISIRLGGTYGFGREEGKLFDQTPEVILQRTVTGPVLMDSGYSLSLEASIVDAGTGPGETVNPASGPGMAVGSASDPVNGWGPECQALGVTVIGTMRVRGLTARGGIWTHPLLVLDNQRGCIRSSFVSGNGDRLPQNIGCVRGTGALLTFTSRDHNAPSYFQITRTTDRRIREEGPDGDAMGAYGFLREAHAWRNLAIRFREYMPVGIRPLIIPVT